MCPITKSRRLQIIYRLHDCKIFTKLDLRQGYHQLALDSSTKKVATFSTPWGNYRPQRLVFGAKSSQDVFDEAMLRVFGDIHHCSNQRDDILLGGRDKTEHREVLKTALRRARDHGITFNREKCQFGMQQTEFFGHVFSMFVLFCFFLVYKSIYLSIYLSNYLSVYLSLFII